MLHCQDLTCVREERILFNSLNFKISSGQIVQVEGPNGVGKTSLFRLITGLSLPYSGAIFWQGENINDDRETFYQNLLYLGHKTGVKPELTAFENLQFFQIMQGRTKLCSESSLFETLAKVGLTGYEDIPTAQLSAGQQRRVALARLWLNDCSLWILDEPFTAIDKAGVAILEALFIDHAKKGGIVLLTTHQDLTISGDLFSKIRLEKEGNRRYV
ncbi:MAG TPA: cytochrome c biogenesis heme-transporting ATPase CcmA [Psychromonas hadalis]|nr:cytochrome c biogenesis heme-transporting ATPase CcmA [Psychromonas hadalis]